MLYVIINSMANRDIKLNEREIYHIYNRGVDKRIVFEDKQDFFQFLKRMKLFNNINARGGVREYSYRKHNRTNYIDDPKHLVEIIAFCLNPNHFHLILRQVSEDGISKFMHKLGTGYTKYFNQKNKRSGALFGGNFKSVHVDSDIFLKHLTAYVNLNFKVHNIPIKSKNKNQLFRSSWLEYIKDIDSNICKKESVLNLFNSKKSYEKFAKESLQNILTSRGYLVNKNTFLELD